MSAYEQTHDEAPRPYPLPLPLLPETESSAPYPLTALGGVLGSAAAAISETTQVAEALAAQSVLGAAAMAAQPIANVQRDGLTIPLSLFLLTVAESGDRKTAADRLALHSHYARQNALQNSYRSEQRKHRDEQDAYLKARTNIIDKLKAPPEIMASELGKLIEPLPPRFPILLAEEPTIEGLQKAFLRGHPSQGLFSDEGGQFFGGQVSRPENMLRSLAGLSRFWDGSPFTRTRATEGESASLSGCRLSIHLMIQPFIAQEVLCNPMMLGQGFLARFLIAWPPSLAGSRLYRALDPHQDERLIKYWQRMSDLLETELTKNVQGDLAPPPLTLEPAAKHAWIKSYNEIEAELGAAGTLLEIKATASKAAEQLLRIAGVLAVSEGTKIITLQTLEWATTLIHWYLAEALRLINPAKTDPRLVSAQRLLDWVKAKGWKAFHRDTLGAQGPTRGKAKLRNELLAILLEHHHLLSCDGKEYRINPASSAESADTAVTR